jgi:hypothetical protein
MPLDRARMPGEGDAGVDRGIILGDPVAKRRRTSRGRAVARGRQGASASGCRTRDRKSCARAIASATSGDWAHRGASGCVSASRRGGARRRTIQVARRGVKRGHTGSATGGRGCRGPRGPGRGPGPAGADEHMRPRGHRSQSSRVCAARGTAAWRSSRRQSSARADTVYRSGAHASRDRCGVGVPHRSHAGGHAAPCADPARGAAPWPAPSSLGGARPGSAEATPAGGPGVARRAAAPAGACRGEAQARRVPHQGATQAAGAASHGRQRGYDAA